MEFKTDFKERIYQAFQYNKNIESIMSALESNNTTIFRYLIEDYLDELKTQLDPRELIDDEHLIWNSQVQMYKRVQKLYSEFMEEYVKEVHEEQEKEVKIGR